MMTKNTRFMAIVCGALLASACGDDDTTRANTNNGSGDDTTTDGGGDDSDIPSATVGGDDGADDNDEQDGGAQDSSGGGTGVGETAGAEESTGEETEGAETTGEATTGQETAGETAGEETGGAAACAQVTPGQLRVAQPGLVVFEGELLGDEDTDQFRFEFYTEATGVFDLSAAPNDNYVSCEQCILVNEDISDKAPVTYYQAGGTLEIAEDINPQGSSFSATLSGVRLVEVTIADDFVSTPVVDGGCIEITDGFYSTPVVPDTWTCDPGFFGDGDCDCGCGALDEIDCTDAAIESCDFCDNEGSCSEAEACPGTINPVDNSRCTAESSACEPGDAAIASSATGAAISDAAPVVETVELSGLDAFTYRVVLDTTITHTYNDDLEITLTSPAGTEVLISRDNGASSDDVFNGVTWTDSGVAVTDIVFADGVSETSLAPQAAMGAFRGEDPNGTWTLTINDTAAGDEGVLAEWTLRVEAITLPQEGREVFEAANVLTIDNEMPAVDALEVATGITSLCGLSVTTDITHTFCGDLDVTLTSPAGSVTTLTTDNGAENADVFNGTVWSDDAADLAAGFSYADGVVAASLVPEGALGAFMGEDPNGTWRLEVVDDAAGDEGVLSGWSLDLVSCTCGQ